MNHIKLDRGLKKKDANYDPLAPNEENLVVAKRVIEQFCNRSLDGDEESLRKYVESIIQVEKILQLNKQRIRK